MTIVFLRKYFVMEPLHYLPIFLLLIVPVLAAEWKKNHVEINERRKNIDVDTSWLGEKSEHPVQQVGLNAADKEKVFLDLITEKKQLSASAHGNVAVAETSGGQRAQVQRFGDKGGLAQVEGHRYH
jgi:hypothetical protein